MTLRAVIFDLDGVLTDTAEYHYRSWQRLADEHGWPFSREMNERLRGVSRRASLEILLDGRAASEAEIEGWMATKNEHYQAMVGDIGPGQLLPGVGELLDALDAAGIRYAVGSASKNARQVLDALGIAGRFAIIADGHTVTMGKPAPDLFLAATQALGVARDEVVVVEDAESGIDAALTGGLATLGIGPAERVGHAHHRVDNTSGMTLDALREALGRAHGWRLHEAAWAPAEQNHKETVFTAGNGLVAARGALEEGHPGERRASFVHGIFDDVPIAFTEIANIPDWMGMQLVLNGVPFSMASGTLLEYDRQMNLRDGLLTRTLRWRAPSGEVTRLRFERLIGRAPRHVLAVRVQATPQNWVGTVEVRGGLFGYSDNEGILHWQHLAQGAERESAWLHSRTLKSAIELALASSLTRVDGAATVEGWSVPGQPTQRLVAEAAGGEAVTVVKLVALADSRHEREPLPVARARLAEASDDFDALVAANRRAWAGLWAETDVEVWGDPEAQRALRFNLYQMLAVMPEPGDDVNIGAKSLSGFGYRGHAFWDTEIFMLPLFTFTQPERARELLLYRYRRLAAARAKARANGVEGAQFPWESAATGEEVTPTWVPHFADRTKLVRIWTGDIEIHITADIAYATMQYWRVTGDDEFMRDFGAELVLDGATFWASRAEWDEARGAFGYTDVIGPDEYHDHVDQNAFTNAMARWQIERALSLLSWLDEEHPAQGARLRQQLDLSEARLARWREVAEKMWLPVSDDGLIEQFEGYFDLFDPPLASYEPRTRSMQEILGIEGANEAQILKQPDVLMLLFLMRDVTAPEQVRANWDYYDPRTDHTFGSSLGPSISAIMACEMGLPTIAYEHFMRAARADLTDVRGNASDGIHAASAGGLWQAAVLGFGGLTLTEQGWRAEARLPDHWTRLRFRFRYRGDLQVVDFVAGESERAASAEGSQPAGAPHQQFSLYPRRSTR